MTVTRGGWTILLALMLALSLSPAAFPQAPKPERVADLKMALRDLLVGHIVWARTMVIASRMGDRTEARVAEARAIQNARALGQAVGSFYGAEAGRKFADLFIGHNEAVKDYLEASLSGNEARKKAAHDRAARNAQEIDAFLSGANPNLPKGAVLSLLVSHWAHHVAQIDAATKRNWAQEAQVWDEMLKHIYRIADALAEAIAKQFPDKFA
jgi:hypothetical protein